MKSNESPHAPLNRSLHFWAFHLGCTVPTISRWLKDAGIRPSRRKADPGFSLPEILSAIDYRRYRK
ncbi:MAG TPA: hypothetical protein VIK35_09090 [Verrucomicrobiae bacterium]